MPPEEIEDSVYFPSYSEHAKTLRTWFVAYGIGGPVVLLSSDKAWNSLVLSGCSPYIGFLFLTGGIIQILSALLNKHSMWLLYLEEAAGGKKPDNERSLIFKLADWYSVQTWIDVLSDAYTLILFGWATRLAFDVLSHKEGAKVCNPTLSEQIICMFIIMILIAVLYIPGRALLRRATN
ncbi:MAG TPA: hypothetical protein VGW12_11660 [Pyrinomonadaceae bacterium]|nr:hypothetical protein [Pyrinomonadaceae bacterium]